MSKILAQGAKKRQMFFDSLTVEDGPCPRVQLSDNKTGGRLGVRFSSSQHVFL